MSFERAIPFILLWEAGYQCMQSDPGNWTGGKVGSGELRGTKYGISAAQYPMLDIKNISLDDAKLIYRKDYWKVAGCETLPWPLCLAVLDTAVLCGPGRARAWAAEFPDWQNYIMRRIGFHNDSPREDLDDGWINRLVQKGPEKPGLWWYIRKEEHPISEEYK